MTENEVAAKVLDASFEVHRLLGPGLLESIYENILAFELDRAGLTYRRQCPVPINYKGKDFGIGLRLDLLVADLVVVELKSVEAVLPVHKKQLLSYLRLMDLRLGLLINFNSSLLYEGITRVVNKLPEDGKALRGPK